MAGENKIPRNLPNFYVRDENMVTIKVKDKDDPKKIQVFHFPKGTEITGNKFKTVLKEDGELELTKYQLAALAAAAEGDEFGGAEDSVVDRYDTQQGSQYGKNISAKLAEYSSGYRVSRNPNYDGKGFNADATEYGLFFATFENDNGEKGRFEIKLPDQK